jgi:hypothetical protein
VTVPFMRKGRKRTQQCSGHARAQQPCGYEQAAQTGLIETDTSSNPNNGARDIAGDRGPPAIRLCWGYSVVS